MFRYHGDWRGAAALQASAHFVRSCVQVNTFCSLPSVQAQICRRAGRLGWKRSRGREREMEGRKGGNVMKGNGERGDWEERGRGRTLTSVLVIKHSGHFCDQMFCLFQFDFYLMYNQKYPATIKQYTNTSANPDLWQTQTTSNNQMTAERNVCVG